MKLTNSALRLIILQEIKNLSRTRLFEAEDDADDVLGDDEGDSKESGEGDDTGSEAGDAGEDALDAGEDESDAKEAEDEPEEDADSDKEEKEEEPEPEPTGPVGDEVDIALKDVMADFEKKALDAAAAKSKIEPIKSESRFRRPSLASLLFEAEDEKEKVIIDVGTFAGEVARLINNYDTLIDMEGVIYAKARDFLEKKYGVEYADQLDDILASEYDLELDHKNDPEKAEQTVYAVGATGSGGGA